MKRKYDSVYDKVFGEYFTDIRVSRGITRRYVAQRLKLKEEALATYEHGTRACPMSVFKALCDFYGLDIVETFRELEKMATSEAKKWKKKST